MINTTIKRLRKAWTFIFGFTFGSCLLIAETTGDTYAFNELRRILGGSAMDDYTSSTIFWLGFTFALVAATPVVITILGYTLFPKLVHPGNVSDVENTGQPQPGNSAASNEESPNTTNHSFWEWFKDLAFIGTPFGLLAYGSSKAFTNLVLQPNNTRRKISDIGISLAASFASMYGNMKLHGDDDHNSDSYFTLLKKLPNLGAQIKAIVFSLSVFLGHICQGSLDAFAFLKQVPRFWTPAQAIIAGLLGLLVAYFEGKTEMCETLRYMTNELGRENPHLLTKIVLIIPAIFHGLLPTIGAINIVEAIYKLIHNCELISTLTLLERIFLFVGAGIIVGIINGRTYMNMVSPATNALIVKAIPVVKDVGTMIVEHPARLFRCIKTPFFNNHIFKTIDLSADGSEYVPLKKRVNDA